MSQINLDEPGKRAELLKLAKQILIQDYDAMRGTNHQQWLRESQLVWKTKGILIGYPTAKLFPTEQEIVTKALELYNNLNQPITNTSTTSTETPVTTTAPIAEVPLNVDPVAYSDMITPSITAQLQAAYNAPVERSVISPIQIPDSPIVEPTITSIVQAGGDFVIIDEPIVSDDPVPVIEEPVVEEINSEEPAAKHSLLRSVLSGWLSKNKNKDES